MQDAYLDAPKCVCYGRFIGAGVRRIELRLMAGLSAVADSP
jgi:hypothetical protein